MLTNEAYFILLDLNYTATNIYSRDFHLVEHSVDLYKFDIAIFNKNEMLFGTIIMNNFQIKMY